MEDSRRVELLWRGEASPISLAMSANRPLWQLSVELTMRSGGQGGARTRTTTDLTVITSRFQREPLTSSGTCPSKL